MFLLELTVLNDVLIQTKDYFSTCTKTLNLSFPQQQRTSTASKIYDVSNLDRTISAASDLFFREKFETMKDSREIIKQWSSNSKVALGGTPSENKKLLAT